jgi:hypothetical protein
VPLVAVDRGAGRTRPRSPHRPSRPRRRCAPPGRVARPASRRDRPSRPAGWCRGRPRPPAPASAGSPVPNGFLPRDPARWHRFPRLVSRGQNVDGV